MDHTCFMVDSSTAAELAAASEAVERYRQRVADLATPHLGTEREDLLSAIFEAERSLRTAQRLLTRAAKVAQRATR
jgi:hypothetical protein